jgi:hypothetical protein
MTIHADGMQGFVACGKPVSMKEERKEWFILFCVKAAGHEGPHFANVSWE